MIKSSDLLLKAFAFLLFLPLCAADGIVTNGSFDGPKGTIPEGWTWKLSNNADCKMELDGKGVLVMKSNFKQKPHVFGRIQQSVKLMPGGSYVLNVRAKGSGDEPIIAIGKNWKLRFHIKPPAPEWRTYTFNFTIPESEVGENGVTPLLILCEGVMPAAYIDSIEIKPVSIPNLSENEWQPNRVYAVRKAAGNPAAMNNIPAGPAKLRLPLTGANTEKGVMPSPADLSAEIAFGYDAEGLLFFANVRDDAARFGSDEQMYQADSIQLRFDRAGSRLAKAAPTDLEIGFSVDEKSKVHTWCWDAGRDPFAGRPLPPELAVVHGKRDKSGYFIAARLDWKLLAGIDPENNGKFGFTVVVNDSDGSGRRAAYFLTPGLHDDKYSNQYIRAVFETGKPSLWAAPDSLDDAAKLSGSLLAAGLSGAQEIKAEVTGADGKSVTKLLGIIPGVKPGELIDLPFDIPLDKIAQGEYTADFKANGTSLEKLTGSKVDLYRQQLEITAGLESELKRLNAVADALFYGERPRSEYIASPLYILNEHLPRIRRRLVNASDDGAKKYYAEQAAMTNAEIAETLSDIAASLAELQAGRKLPETWKFRTSPIRQVDGWPVAEAVNEEGKTVERPVVSVGYGHFHDIDRDIEKFQNLAANTVQIEIGPDSLFPVEGKIQEFEPDFAKVDRRLRPLMEKAWKNNVKIILLISPHYHPDWFMKKYPEVKTDSPSFLKYEVTHPKAQEMVRKYISELLGHLKKSPYAGSLHSVCISNEAVYVNCKPENPCSAAMFCKYMEKKYGPVANFNRTAKTAFKSYEEMTKSTKNSQAARYEFYLFSRVTFAGWHRMMAGEVRKAWPGIPVHTKIMSFRSTYDYVMGVDPELMAEFSDYNGNDNNFYREGRWQADWLTSALSHEIQISSKPVAVVNSENHIIRDRESQPIPNDHIYSALFQQYITGVCTMTTWLYADIDYERVRKDPKHDFIGNIYLRPGNLAAHARASLDGMRLAPLLQKFLQYKPEVALLYSPTSILLKQGTYKPQLEGLYQELCFTGYRPGMLTERRLAAGEFGDVKVLFVPGAANVTRAALRGMEKFARQGGRIIVDAGSLQEDEFGNPVKPAFRTEPVAALNAKSLTEQIRSSVAPLPAGVRVAHRDGNEGVFFRMVPAGDGSWLVNLVNYNFEPRRIELAGDGEWFDLIAEKPFVPAVELAPLKPHLLRFTPTKQQ
ncbi:MAG: hypothetical protein HPZ91_04325 [Lentisphaeria bacterium]|nr:hypothetical protein [Lentisphaeria bacterium]